MRRKNLSSWSDIGHVAGPRGGHRLHHTLVDSGGAVLADFGQARPNSPPHHHPGQLLRVCR